MTTITTIDPSTGKVLKTYPCNTQLNAIVDTADAGFKSWSITPLTKRTTLLLKLSDGLKAGASNFAALIHQEMGKTYDEAMAEVLKCATLCEYYAQHAKAYLDDAHITREGTDASIVIAPLGIVLGIMPWNFPFWQVLRAAIPIITSGNTFILKHAPNCTGSGLAIAELFKVAGFPEGVFQTIVAAPEVALKLLTDARLIGVTFTGSARAGSAIASFAGLHLKRVVLELGGTDAAVILDDADIAHAASVLVTARLSNAGQVCIAPKRMIVTQKNAEAFIQAVKACAKSITIGPMAREDLRTQLHQQVLVSVKEGAKLVFGGELPDGAGFYYPPTLLTHVLPAMTAATDEVFGPVIVVMIAKDEVQALAWANESHYGLGASVFTQDSEKAELFATQLAAGSVYINDKVISDPALPFGGIKHSGFGRELSREGLIAFCNIKTVVRPNPFQ